MVAATGTKAHHAAASRAVEASHLAVPVVVPQLSEAVADHSRPHR